MYFHMPKNITLCTFVACFWSVESSPCILKPIWLISMLFHCKDTVEKKIGSDFVYCNTCVNFRITCYGKIYFLSFTRAGILTFLNQWGKCLWNVKQCAIYDHLLGHNCSIDCYCFICLNESPLKLTKKCFLFHLQSSFPSHDIKVFVLTCWSCRKKRLD